MSDDTPQEPPADSDVPPPPPVAEEGDPLEHIVDDTEHWDEARAWAYWQLHRGQTGEDVTDALVNNGWSLDDAERLVLSARRSPGAADAAAGVAPLYKPRGGLIGGIVNLLVGVVNAIMGASDADRDLTAGQRAERLAAGRCVRCGFDLHGSAGPCPNCGAQQPAKLG
jgi:hypothetical protein